MKQILKGLGLVLVSMVAVFPLSAETEFLPEDGTIKENEIIVRMQKELGESLKNKKERKLLSSPQTNPSNSNAAPYIELTANFPGNKQIKGKVLLSQKYINIKQKDGTVRVPVNKIKQIFWNDWKITYSRKYKGKTRKYFFPQNCSVRTGDGKSFKGKCNARDWLQLTVKTGSAVQKIQIYYTAEDKTKKPGKKENFISLDFSKGEAQSAGLEVKK